MRKDDEEVKHVCKFCDKSFPSGRQLCGHMSSHQNHSNYVDGDRIGKKKKKRRRMRKRKSLDLGGNFGGEVGFGSGGSRTSFVLGENPRKSWRPVDESSKEVWLDRDKSCRECGRGFGSWKALLGHMKRHALEDRDSRTGNDLGAMVEGWEEDSRLDDEDKEEVAVPSRRRRSERRKRYMVAAASSSSVSLVSNINDVNDNGNHRVGSSVPEIDQEQEEVAMCLMLLSRDVGHRKTTDSVTDESSKRSSLDAKRGGGIIGNSGLDNLEAENENQFQSQVDLPEFGSTKDSISAQGSQMGTMKAKVSKIIDRKRSLSSDMNDSELGMKTQKEFADDGFGFGLLSGVKSDKRGRFECTTCNKAFQSYQALGGHKASHSRIKDCFGGNIISKAEISHPAKGQKMIEKTVNVFVGKKHECLVCLKVFPSGQALGGHKRTHMQPGSVAEGASVVEPVANARDVFDLNLPAQMEDEGSSHVTVNSWCSQRPEESFTRF